jgi:nucleotide-binding universal stress UspA family protein
MGESRSIAVQLRMFPYPRAGPGVLRLSNGHDAEAAMDIRTIALILESDRAYDALVAASCNLAARHGAFIEAYCIHPAPEASLAECFAIGARADADVALRLMAESKAQIAPVEQDFENALVAGRAKGLLRSFPKDGAPASLLPHVRLADLIIMAPHAGEDHWAIRVKDRILLESGTPCLFVPAGCRIDRPDRILLAWNGSREAKRALDAGLVFLRGASHVQALIVGSTDDAEPGPAALRAYLARHGVECSVALGQGHPEDAIESAANSLDAELLIMGAYAHLPTRERWLGGVTQAALDCAASPLLMAH